MYSPFWKDFVALVGNMRLRKNLPGKNAGKTLRYSHTPQFFMCLGNTFMRLRNTNAGYPTRQQVLFKDRLPHLSHVFRNKYFN